MQILVIACRKGHFIPLETLPYHPVKAALGVFVLHIMRSGAKLGNKIAVLDFIPRHSFFGRLAYSHTPASYRHYSEHQRAYGRYKRTVVFRYLLRYVKRINKGVELLHFTLYSDRTSVKRKNVYRYSLRNIQILLRGLYTGCIIIDYCGKNIADEFVLCGFKAGITACIGIFGPQLKQPFVILARHKNVDIIIPGDESSVPKGPYAAAAAKKDTQSVLVAKIP